jgi:hypothetical protein
VRPTAAHAAMTTNTPTMPNTLERRNTARP